MGYPTFDQNSLRQLENLGGCSRVLWSSTKSDNNFQYSFHCSLNAVKGFKNRFNDDFLLL